MLKKTILIVEDEVKIIEFIQSYLENSGYNAVVAENGFIALEKFRSAPIDMVLLDLMLPDLSGEAVCRSIRMQSNVPIIMITAKSDETSIISGLTMGADDYITKPFSPRQLIARIQAIFRRIEQGPQSTVSFTSLQIQEETYSILLSGQDLKLTATEYQLLHTLLKRPSKVFTRDELAEIVFMGNYEGYTRSIDSHIKNIRNKLSVYSDKSYIKTIRGIGYQYCEEENEI